MQTKTPPPNNLQTFKTREINRVFEAIEDEITLITANAQFKYTTCKTDQTALKLTLAYIDDTKKIINMLKARMNLLQEATS
jgi:hypothetical protein